MILAVFLAAGICAAGAIGSQRSLCTGITDGSFVGDPDSCSKFFICYNSEAVGQSCEQGSYFNSTDLYCQPDTDNVCPSTQPSECAENGAYSAHPNECALFYICYDGKLVEQSCEQGSYFNSTDLYCLPDMDNVCPPKKPSECTENGAYSAHPNECALFYICYDGKLVEQSCEQGSYFNSTDLYCLPDTDNVCPPNKPSECTENGAYSAHPNECALFYICYDGKLVEQSCEQGSYFNSTDLYCLPDTDNVCPPNKPSECTENGAYSAHPNECALFYICYDGKLVEQSCEQGSYFNSTDLYCLPDTDNVCPPKKPSECAENGAYIAHPTECALFYICYDGKLVEQSCEQGSYFNSTDLYCLPDTDNVCPPKKPSECAENGAYSAHPNECALFYICYDGKLVEQSCEQGSYFNSTDLYCLPDTDNVCPPKKPSECAENGAYSAHPNECALFYICYDGKLVEQSCEQGSYFNSTDLYCLPDTDNVCPPKKPSECAENGAYSAHPNECALFYICYDGKLVEQSCEQGSYFNSTDLYCLPDTDNVCPPKKPSECAENGAYSAHPNECALFYICYDGKLVEQSCEQGSYFNSTDLYCLPDTDNVCPPKKPSECAENGAYSAHPNECALFYICYDGKLVEQSCEQGSYFNSTDLYCLPDMDNVCPPKKPSECAENGAYSAHPNECALFYICYDGKLVEQSCEQGSYFNSTDLYCLPDTDNVCPPKKPSECAENGAYIAHPTECALFYICYYGKLVEQSCEQGSYFNSTDLYCLPDTDNVCPPKKPSECAENGAYIAHPTECALFYICYNGKLVEQSCEQGSYFNSTDLYCLPDTDNVCPPTQPSECAENGAYSAHPTECALFYICYDGKLVEQSCEQGSYFNSTDLYCLPDTDNVCPPTQPSECAENGAYSAHPTECALFYICYDGKLVEQSCEQGSYFNSTDLYCLPDTDNVCPPKKPSECAENGAYIAHPTECALFYICFNGKLVEQSCEQGSYFNSTDLYCLPDTDNVCPPKKPSECAENGAYIAHPTECALFYICFNGKLVEQSCEQGSYFNSTDLYCLPDTDNVCPPKKPSECTENGAISPYPGQCALFYVCNYGLLVEQTCGVGRYFDTENLYCLPDTNNVCWPSTTTEQSPCTCSGGYTNGEFVAIPDSCYSYYVCSDGELVQQNCGYGNYFNSTDKRCERDVTGECWPLSSTTTTTTQAPCTSCEGGYNQGDFVASDDSCYSFSLCDRGALVELSCGFGNYFDRVTKVCERDYEGKCWTTLEPPIC